MFVFSSRSAALRDVDFGCRYGVGCLTILVADLRSDAAERKALMLNLRVYTIFSLGHCVMLSQFLLVCSLRLLIGRSCLESGQT